MYNRLILLIFTLLSFNCFAQIQFEKGYFIDNDNQKVECLIKNIDWRNNPTEFEYRSTEDGVSQKADINAIKEFGIIDKSKFIRATVLLDRSTTSIMKMTKNKNPMFTEEVLFLSVLVEGKSNLYQYVESNLIRFFYTKDTKIEQLIFKKYITVKNNLGQNNRFRNQLWENLKCPTIKMNAMMDIDYKKTDLIKFFKAYNACHNNEGITHEEKSKRDLFNLSLRPRINHNSLSIFNSFRDERLIDFGSKTGFGFGLELEYIFPFNKNKWSMFFEPTYQNFSASVVTDASNVSGGKLYTSIDYQSIEVPVGIRHYFFLNEKTRLFLNAALIFDFNMNSLIELKREDGSRLAGLEFNTLNNYAVGLGYNFNDRFSLEARYQTSRDLLVNYDSWHSDYKTMSFIVGYSLF